MRTILMSLMVGATMLAVSATSRGVPPVKPDSNPAVLASNGFACDLFRKLSDAEPDRNLLFSPYSIESALAMALEGARADTALEMGETLRLPKTLRDRSALQPWRTEPFGKGLKTVADRLLADRDTAQVEADRVNLSDMRRELADLNDRIKQARRERQSDEARSLSRDAKKLADAINALDRQVDQFDLRVANALWGDKSHPFDAGYLGSVDRNFGAGRLRLADFRNDYPTERTVINQWVEEQTNQRIKELLPKLAPAEAQSLRLVLVNAIFFKGEWSRPFRERDTKKGDFLLADNSKAPAKLMHQTLGVGRFGAFNGDGTIFETPRTIPESGPTEPDEAGFSIAELPIKGGRIAMAFVAPQKADGLPAIEALLTEPNVTAWLARLERRTMHVVLPRYKVETSYELGTVLKEMGMKRAFSNQDADFSGMTESSDPSDRLSLSRVIHKAFVEVNEKGAEAAAATATMGYVRSAAKSRSRPYTPTFRGDRPFLYLIRDTSSGMILFMGRVTRPS